MNISENAFLEDVHVSRDFDVEGRRCGEDVNVVTKRYIIIIHARDVVAADLHKRHSGALTRPQSRIKMDLVSLGVAYTCVLLILLGHFRIKSSSMSWVRSQLSAEPELAANTPSGTQLKMSTFRWAAIRSIASAKKQPP